MAIDWRKSSLLGGVLLAGVAAGAVGVMSFRGGDDSPPARSMGAGPSSTAFFTAVAGNCEMAPMLPRAGEGDGREVLQAKVASASADEVSSLILTGKEAAAAGRNRDAEVAFLNACRNAAALKDGDGIPLADAMYQLGRHYATVGAFGAPKANELFQRAERLYSASLEAYRARYGAEHEKTKFAQEGLTTVQHATGGKAPTTIAKTAPAPAPAPVVAPEATVAVPAPEAAPAAAVAAAPTPAATPAPAPAAAPAPAPTAAAAPAPAPAAARAPARPRATDSTRREARQEAVSPPATPETTVAPSARSSPTETRPAPVTRDTTRSTPAATETRTAPATGETRPAPAATGTRPAAEEPRPRRAPARTATAEAAPEPAQDAAPAAESLEPQRASRRIEPEPEPIAPAPSRTEMGNTGSTGSTGSTGGAPTAEGSTGLE